MATKNIVPNDNGEGGIGVTGKRWSTAFINTVTGNVTGNLTGQVLTAAQTNITSVGALNGGTITSGFGAINNGASTITTTGLISGGSLDIDNVLINGTTIGHTDDTDLMTLASGVLTVAGELDAVTLDISGNADIDGTLEADAITVNGTALAEVISDTTGAMFSSNTETGVTVTYQDADNTIDVAINADQTTITSLLATDIKIGEDDQTKIDFETADTINFYAGNEKQLILTDGALTPGANNILDLGSASVEFKNAFFDGTVTADAFAGPLTGNVTGTADVATTVTITDNESTNENNAVIFTAGGDVDGGNLGLESDGNLTYNPSSGTLTATAFAGALTGNVTGNASGTAATVTGAAQSNITSLGTLTGLAVTSSAVNIADFNSTNSSTSHITFRYNTNTVAGYIGNGSALGGSATDFIMRSEGGALKFATNANNLALTLDASQNATFAGVIKQSGATSLLTLNDSNSNSSGSSNILEMTDSSDNVLFKIAQTASSLNAEINQVVNGSLAFKTNNTAALTLGSDQKATFASKTLVSDGGNATTPSLQINTASNGLAVAVTNQLNLIANEVTVLTLGADQKATFASKVHLSAYAGTALDPNLLITNSGSGAYNHVIDMLAPNLTNGEQAVITLGKAGSTGNTGIIGFRWTSDNHNDNYIALGGWGKGDQFTFKNNGDQTIADGNLIIGTAGHGITFSSTNSPAQNAGSGSSNTLDNYEEGTFTPTITNANGTLTIVGFGGSGSITGQYTLVGRKVTLHIQFQCTDLDGASSGAIVIGGLPFNATTVGGMGGGGVDANGKSKNAQRHNDITLNSFNSDGGFALTVNVATSYTLHYNI